MIRIIKIEQLENGAHLNNCARFETIPEGYAVVPDDLVTENYPFGDITVEEIDGVMTVTSWTPREIPEAAPIPEEEPTAEEKLNALVGGMSHE